MEQPVAQILPISPANIIGRSIGSPILQRRVENNIPAEEYSLNDITSSEDNLGRRESSRRMEHRIQQFKRYVCISI